MSGARARQKFGLPEDFKAWSAFPFKGLNQSASRIAIDDAELHWQENYIRIGDGRLRTLWDVGAALYTAPVAGSILPMVVWYNIGSAIYSAVFLNDGTAVQVAYPSGTVTTISAAPGTFYQASSGQLPAWSQSGTQYLLISNHNTQNDYWIWDGTLLYGAGSIAPTDINTITSGGSGYTSVPSYTVYGGSGSGVVLTPVIADGSVVSLTVNNPGTGYLPGEIPQVAFSGGGSDTGAILEAVLSASGLAFVTLVSGGSGYTDGNFALGFTGGGGGSGASGAFSVVDGVVVAVVLTGGGSGYTDTPTVDFSASAGGTGAAAVASISSAVVVGANIPNGGTGYTGTPLLTFVGGGGIGATGIAIMSGGSIVAVQMTNGGSGYTSPPAIEIQVGVNNAASAILQIMPFGVSGTSIETYQSRVWISYPNQVGRVNNGGVFFVSAPNSLTDFATSDGGDIFTNSDRFLRQQYTFLRQTSNFLYAVGDSSVSVISNVQTGGQPTSTTFSYQNTDPQVGATWRDTAQDFSNTILFANPIGVYGVYGGSVRKVSKKIDSLFTGMVAPANGGLVPTSAVANLYSQKAFLLLMTITDPFTFQRRNVMVGWDEQEWFVASQSPSLTAIGTQEIKSEIQAWGTDGTHLMPLFATPSSSLVKVLSSKLWGGAQSFMINTAHSVYISAEDVSAAQAGLSFTGSIDAQGLAVPVENSVTMATASCPTGSHSFPEPLNFVAPKGLGSMYGRAAPHVPGIGLGITLATSSPDHIVQSLALGYIETTAVA